MEDIKQSNNYKYIYLFGDFNADFKTVNGTKLLRFCNDHNFQHLINEPTRLTATSQTILDQILTNAPNFVSDTAVLAPVSTNDHCTISATINFKTRPINLIIVIYGFLRMLALMNLGLHC